MEEKAEYIVGILDPFEITLEEGRQKLEHQRFLENAQKSKEQQDLRRAWDKVEEPILDIWPWLKDFINRDDRDKTPSYSVYVYIEIPSFAPMYIKVVQIHDEEAAWKIPSDKEFDVHVLIPMYWNNQKMIWDKSHWDTYASFPLALAIAEERGIKFTEFNRVNQSSIDRRQAEKLIEENLISTKDRLHSALVELIQNEICANCSRCG